MEELNLWSVWYFEPTLVRLGVWYGVAGYGTIGYKPNCIRQLVLTRWLGTSTPFLSWKLDCPLCSLQARSVCARTLRSVRTHLAGTVHAKQRNNEINLAAVPSRTAGESVADGINCLGLSQLGRCQTDAKRTSIVQRCWWPKTRLAFHCNRSLIAAHINV